MTYDLVLTAHDVRVLGAMLATAVGLYYGDPQGRALTVEALGALKGFTEEDIQATMTKVLDLALRRVEDLVAPSPAPGGSR
jgi:transposase